MLLSANLYELHNRFACTKSHNSLPKKVMNVLKSSGLKMEYEYCLFRNIMSRLGGSDVRTLRINISTMNLH